MGRRVDVLSRPQADLLQPSSIIVNSTSAALRIVQQGAGDAIFIEDDPTNPDLTPFAIDQYGQMRIGITGNQPASTKVAIGGNVSINAGGAAGLGALAPLHVDGAIRSSRIGTPSQYVETYSSGGSGVVQATATPLELRSSNGAISFGPNGALTGSIDTSGRLLIGATTSQTIAVAGGLQVMGTGGGAYGVFSRWSADAANPGILFGKSRGGVGTNTIVQSSDNLGEVSFYGANGTGWDAAAKILVSVDGTPGASADMPGRIGIYTTPDGSATPVERMRIDNAGKVGINTSPGAKFHVYDASTADFLLAGNATTIMYIRRSSADATGGRLYFEKDRNAIVNSGDSLGEMHFRGWDGSVYRSAAQISASVDATPGSSDMPGALSFFTTPDGSATLIERMRIDNAGLITGTGSSLGAWTTATPTPTAQTGSFTTVSAATRYSQIGKRMTVTGRVTVTTNGTAAGHIDVPIPTAAVSGTPGYVGAGRESVVSGALCSAVVSPGGSAVRIRKYDSTYPGADGAIIDFTVTYEIA